MLDGLRRIDREAAARVTSWAVNSRTTARRASAAYGLPESAFRVIHPPVNMPLEPAAPGPRQGLLVVSGMQPYKNDRLAVEAAKALELPLTVVGDGPERKALESLAGPRTRFIGYVDDHRLDELYRSHEALVFCGEEDFGIVPLEAIARGCPVVALGRGGAVETVEHGQSGLLFDDTTVDSVIAAITECQGSSWDRQAMHRSAQRFNAMRFREEVSDWINRGIR